MLSLINKMVSKNDKLAFTNDPVIQAIIPFDLGKKNLYIRADHVLVINVQDDTLEPETRKTVSDDYLKHLSFQKEK